MCSASAFERPYCVALGISCLRPQTPFLCRLCVALQMVDELGLRRAKQALEWRAKARLSSGAPLFPHPVERQQLLKVDALELGTTVYNDR